VPRLFDGELPQFNIGTNGNASCSPALTAAVEAACDRSSSDGNRFTRVTNGRFKGGWTTRHYGEPTREVHAIQMELACRGYMTEPSEPFTPTNWPPPYNPAHAAAMRAALTSVMQACLAFANEPSGRTR
jgi:N-formylglutamate deformylase